MIYLYAFADEKAAAVQELRGFGDVPLQSLTRHHVAAVFSEHGQLAVRPDVASLRRHDQVVTALMARGTVAPARFGSTLTDVPQLEAVLADKAPGLGPVLRRLRGKRELSVRATVPSSLPPHLEPAKGESSAPAGSGRAYLRGLGRGHCHRPAIAEPSLLRLHEALAVRARAWTVREGPDHTMVGAYLVSEDDTEAFREGLVAARAEQPHLRVSLTGPWAAYSFVQPERLLDG